jgi:hypothetical protein
MQAKAAPDERLEYPRRRRQWKGKSVWIGGAVLVTGVLLLAQIPGTAQQGGQKPRTPGTVDTSAVGKPLPPPPVDDKKGYSEETGPYDVVRNWPQPLHPDWTWGRTGGVWAESPDRVYIVETGEIPTKTRGAQGNPPKMHAVDHPDTRITEHRFLIVDRNGKLLESWEQHNNLFVHPHSVKQSPYDPDKNVWVIDGRSESGETAHQVWKFSHDGKLLMTLGEHKVQGDDQKHFGGPTDLAYLPNGDFLVADGYRNGRIVRFNKDGKFVSQFGTKGRGPGQFFNIHGIAVDQKGRIFAADRGNSRVQIFDQSGKLLDIWNNIPFPMDIAMTQGRLRLGGRRTGEQVPEVRHQRQAALRVGHVRHGAGPRVGHAPHQRGPGGQPLHRGGVGRPRAEVRAAEDCRPEPRDGVLLRIQEIDRTETGRLPALSAVEGEAGPDTCDEAYRRDPLR